MMKNALPPPLCNRSTLPVCTIPAKVTNSVGVQSEIYEISWDIDRHVAQPSHKKWSLFFFFFLLSALTVQNQIKILFPFLQQIFSVQHGELLSSGGSSAPPGPSSTVSIAEQSSVGIMLTLSSTEANKHWFHSYLYYVKKRASGHSGERVRVELRLKKQP